MSPHVAQLETLLVNVYNQACQEKLAVPRMLGPTIPASPELADIPPDLQNSIRGVVWDLIIQGILIPGIPNQLGSTGLRCTFQQSCLPVPPSRKAWRPCTR
jgi:hypothetical protein